jgi:hypothetical protein
MTVLASLSSRTFNPQIQDVSVSPATLAGLTAIDVTLTHPEWPSGLCFTAEVLWDGVSGGVFTTGGGPRGQKGGGFLPAATLESTIWTTNIRPFTTCTLRVTILQTLTSALLVEGR